MQRFDCSVEAFGFPYSDDDAVPVELPRGSAVFFNGYLRWPAIPACSPGGGPFAAAPDGQAQLGPDSGQIAGDMAISVPPL